MRALGVDLPGLSRKNTERRPYPPGEHGGRTRRRESVYGVQLKEKQKLRFNYGISERQFRRLIKKARGSKTETGLKLLELLERRLDNFVFRAGFAPTIPAARQLVNHGHFTLNGKKVDVASITVSAGDVLGVRERSKSLKVIEAALEQPSLTIPEWISFESDTRVAKVQSMPTKDSVPFPVDVQLVVEYYSRLI